MKNYISLLLLSSLAFGAAMPAYADSKRETNPVQILAQSNSQQAIARDLITLLATGEFEEAVEKYDFQQDVTAESLELDWNDLIEQNGAFEEQLEIVENKDNVVVIRCKFQEKTIDLIVVLNDSNQVISLNTPG